jgi:hypothetical protein
METAPTDIQAKYQKYLASILALNIVVAMFILGSSALDVAAYTASQDSRNRIVDCVDPKKSDSACQTESARRQKEAIGALADITEAYVLCADRLNGDLAIKKCVAERLSDGTEASR